MWSPPRFFDRWTQIPKSSAIAWGPWMGQTANGRMLETCHLVSRARQLLRVLAHFAREHLVAAVHLREEGHPRRGILRRRRREQVHDRSSRPLDVDLAVALVELLLEPEHLGFKQVELALEHGHALVGFVDLVQALRDARGQPVHLSLKDPELPLAGPDLRLRVAKLVPRLAQFLVVGAPHDVRRRAKKQYGRQGGRDEPTCVAGATHRARTLRRRSVSRYGETP